MQACHHNVVGAFSTCGSRLRLLVGEIVQGAAALAAHRVAWLWYSHLVPAVHADLVTVSCRWLVSSAETDRSEPGSSVGIECSLPCINVLLVLLLGEVGACGGCER